MSEWYTLVRTVVSTKRLSRRRYLYVYFFPPIRRLVCNKKTALISICMSLSYVKSFELAAIETVMTPRTSFIISGYNVTYFIWVFLMTVSLRSPCNSSPYTRVSTCVPASHSRSYRFSEIIFYVFKLIESITWFTN